MPNAPSKQWQRKWLFSCGAQRLRAGVTSEALPGIPASLPFSLAKSAPSSGFLDTEGGNDYM
jgi:hypothetical protein